MNNYFLIFILAVKIILSQTSYQNWQLRKSENGIVVYSRDVEGSNFKELKSVFQIKTSLSSVVALLKDFDSYPQWVYRCGESKLLKKISFKESIHYQTVVAPWPVDNRDFIVHVFLNQDTVSGKIVQTGQCLPNYLPPMKDHVRIQLFNAKWTITPLQNGFLKIEYQLMVDPGGNVPAWLVNLAVVDGPFDTAVGMQGMLLKEKYLKANIPEIKEFN